MQLFILILKSSYFQCNKTKSEKISLLGQMLEKLFELVQRTKKVIAILNNPTHMPLLCDKITDKKYTPHSETMTSAKIIPMHSKLENCHKWKMFSKTNFLKVDLIKNFNFEFECEFHSKTEFLINLFYSNLCFTLVFIIL